MEVDDLNTSADARSLSVATHLGTEPTDSAPPVFRPPLRGVPARNLDDGTLGPVPRTALPRREETRTPDIKGVVMAVLKELGITARKEKSVPDRATAPTESRKKARRRKGKERAAASSRPTLPPPLPSPAPSGGAPAPAKTGTGSGTGRKSNKKPKKPDGERRGSVLVGVQEVAAWTAVVQKRAKGAKGPEKQAGPSVRDSSGRGSGRRPPTNLRTAMVELER